MNDSCFDGHLLATFTNNEFLIANGVPWNNSNIYSENRVKFTMYPDQHAHSK